MDSVGGFSQVNMPELYMNDDASYLQTYITTSYIELIGLRPSYLTLSQNILLCNSAFGTLSLLEIRLTPKTVFRIKCIKKYLNVFLFYIFYNLNKIS